MALNCSDLSSKASWRHHGIQADLKLDMPHFLSLRSGRIGPHTCVSAVFPLYTAWSRWTVHCRRNSPALSVAISIAVLLESSLLSKRSAVFSACLNSSPHPGTDQIPPAQQDLLWPSQIELMAPLSSEVDGEPLLMPSTRPFSSFISGRPAAWEHRLLSRHTRASVLALPFPKFMPLGSWPHLSVL